MSCTAHAIDVEGDVGRGLPTTPGSIYYTDEHVETVLRRAAPAGSVTDKIVDAMTIFSGAITHRGRASAAVRLRAPQEAHPAPPSGCRSCNPLVVLSLAGRRRRTDAVWRLVSARKPLPRHQAACRGRCGQPAPMSILPCRRSSQRTVPPISSRCLPIRSRIRTGRPRVSPQQRRRRFGFPGQSIQMDEAESRARHRWPASATARGSPSRAGASEPGRR